MAEAQLKMQLSCIDSMTNVELRAELKRRGCSTSGNKKDLLAKLRDALQKEYDSNTEQTSLNTSTDDKDKSMNDQNSSIDNSKLSEKNETSSVSSTPERRTSTRNKKSSIKTEINDNINTTSDRMSTQEHNIVLDTSTNNNNVEVKTFVSTSSENNQKDREIIGVESHLSSVGSSNAKSESIVKESLLLDDQQHISHSKAPTINEQQNSAIEIPNDELNSKSQTEFNGKSSDMKLSADIQLNTSIPEDLTKNENETNPQVSQLKAGRPQQVSSTKALHRSMSNKINLTLELLKTLISDTTLIPESIINAEFDALINEQMNNSNSELITNESVLETSIDNNLLSEAMTIGELADQKQQTNRTVVMNAPNESSSTSNDLLNRKKQISSFELKTIVDGKSNIVLTDEPIRIKTAALSTESASQILYINGLTRPFSLFQLKGLLSRYGTLVEGEFWLDKIKSQCFATYNTIEEAVDAREALDGCRWPSTNPKVLSVRFSRREEFELIRSNDSPVNRTENRNLSSNPDSNERIIQEKSNLMHSNRSISPKDETKGNTKKKRTTDVREWDKDKIQNENDEIENQIDNNEEKETVKANEPPAKGLDDYFRKTKAKPSIYWLPLTEEQIIERDRQREQRNTEREEEQKRREFEEKKSHRRSSSPYEKRKRSSSPTRRNHKRH